jgi:hypothetical protein
MADYIIRAKRNRCGLMMGDDAVPPKQSRLSA